MLAMLFGCGFRGSELVGLELSEIQIRQGHWGGGGSGWQARPHPHGADSRVGQDGPRSVDGSSGGYGGKSISRSCQDGEGMGTWHLTECGLVRGEDLLRESGIEAHRGARLATNMREVVPR